MLSVLATVRGWHRPLLVNVALMLALAAVSAVGLVADDRMLLDESVWAKPLKFAAAFVVYGLTLAWLLTKLTRARRFGWWLGTAFAVFGIADVAVVAAAGAAGTFSHFNSTGDPLNQVVQTTFAIGVPALFVANLAIAVLVLFQRTGDRAETIAIRSGLALATVGMVVAFWITSFEVYQPRLVPDASGELVRMSSGHGVGVPDGSGLPLLNWSTVGGDLRVPHFVGLHGIQVLLLLVVGLAALGRRHGWLRDERVRARLVGVAAAGYAGLFAVVTWQAFRGQSVVDPDLTTLTALGTVAVLTAAGATAVVTGARGPRSATPKADERPA